MTKKQRLLARNCILWFTKDRIAACTAIVLFLWGAVLLFVIPPFQSPDEPQHTYRAWDISRGHLLCQQSDYIISVPAFLVSVQNHFPREQAKFTQLGIATQNDTSYNRTNDTPVSVYSQFCAYNPLGYMPTTVGSVLSGIFNLNAIGTVLLMRLSNLLFATILVYVSIRIIPFAKGLVSAFSLLPMLAFQFSTTSSDAVAIPLLLAYTSAILWARNQKSLSVQQLTLISGLSLIAVHAKPGYIVFATLVLCVHASASKTMLIYRSWLMTTMLLHIGVFLALLGLTTANGYYDGYYQNIEPYKQLLFILQHPIHFISLIYQDILLNSWVYLNQIIGYFGWLTVQLQPATIIFTVIGLLVLYFQWKEPVLIANRERLIIGTAAVLGIISLYTIAYIAWTPYQDIKICCLQGRYFIPYIWLLALAFWQVAWNNKTTRLIFIIGVGLLIAQSTYALLAGHYQ